MSKQSSLHPDAPERHRAFKQRGPKPWIVEWRSKNSNGLFRNWTRFGRYASEAVAREVIRKKSNCPYFDFRLVSTSF